MVNNAGTLGNMLGPPEWYTIEEFQNTMNVNTTGCVRLSLAFLPLIKKAKGRLVFMSSAAGRTTGPLSIPYCMSKHAIESFADGLR